MEYAPQVESLKIQIESLTAEVQSTKNKKWAAPLNFVGGAVLGVAGSYLIFSFNRSF